MRKKEGEGEREKDIGLGYMSVVDLFSFPASRERRKRGARGRPVSS